MCHSKANEAARNAGISFFRFPKDKRKRSLWTKVIHRADWEPNDSVRICSLHFVDGWHSDDTDINYVPTIFPYKEKTHSTKQKARETRTVSRQETKDLLAEEQLQRCIDQTNRDSAILAHSYSTVEPEVEISLDHNAMDVEDDIELPYVQTRTIGTFCISKFIY
ncbi:THAP domain-containing protein 11-like [Mytilus trossulus]|uniref:THAP domain-containing protein 11-like n=1 Tax=Mytilus trossulus TaxID=6551 RepID=UPI003006B6D4